MKKHLFVLLAFFSLFVTDVAVATITCEQAVASTCGHFSNPWQYPDITVTYGTIAPPYCKIYNAENGITCMFEGGFCPNPPTPNTEGHNEPGVVTCLGCQDDPYNLPFVGSINEGKCCILFGQPTNPNTGEVFC